MNNTTVLVQRAILLNALNCKALPIVHTQERVASQAMDVNAHDQRCVC